MKLGLLTAALLASATTAHAQSTVTGGQLLQVPPAPEIPQPDPNIRIEPTVVEPESGAAGASIRVNSLRTLAATLFPSQR